MLAIVSIHVAAPIFLTLSSLSFKSGWFYAVLSTLAWKVGFGKIVAPVNGFEPLPPVFTVFFTGISSVI